MALVPYIDQLRNEKAALESAKKTTGGDKAYYDKVCNSLQQEQLKEALNKQCTSVGDKATKVDEDEWDKAAGENKNVNRNIKRGTK